MAKRSRRRKHRVYTDDALAPARGDKIILVNLDNDPDGRETTVLQLTSRGVGEEEGMYEVLDERGHTYIVEKVSYDTWIQSQP